MFLDGLSLALNDPDQLTWPRSQLVEWVNIAIAQVVARNPLLATETQILPAKDNPIRNSKYYIAGADLLTDAHGRKIGNLFKGTPRRATCESHFYTIDNGAVSIQPQLDRNKDYHIRARVVDVDNPPASMAGVIAEYVLYRAHVIDAETTGVISDVSTRHRTEYHKQLEAIPFTSALRK